MAKGTIVITGANGGIGSAILSRIASSPELASYHCISTVRPQSLSAFQAQQQHQSQHDDGATSTTVPLELSRLASVREAASAINARVATGEILPIRALILNAGYQEMDAQRFTEDGFSMAFAVNYLGHWLLVLLLLQSMDRDAGRIVVLGSKAHDPSKQQNSAAFKDDKWKMMFHDSTDPIARGTWSSFEDDPSWNSGLRRYGASKLCAIMMIGALQRRLDTDPVLNNVSVLGVDPGTVPTNIMRHSPWFMRVLLFQLILPAVATLQSWLRPHVVGAIRTAAQSASDVLAAALDSNPVLGERPKGLYLDGPQRAEISAEARDRKKWEVLWRDSVRYAQLREGETTLTSLD